MSQDKTTGTRKGGLQETSLHKLTQRKQRVLSYPGQFQMRLALTLTNSCKNKCLKYCRGQKCGFLDLSYLSRDLDRFHRLATVISGLNTAGSKSTWKNVHMHRGKKTRNAAVVVCAPLLLWKWIGCQAFMGFSEKYQLGNTPQSKKISRAELENCVVLITDRFTLHIHSTWVKWITSCPNTEYL